MSRKDVAKYWLRSGRKDFDVAKGLYRLKYYSHSLFFCHLSLEKILKAVYVLKQKKNAPYIHDLVILAKKSGIELSSKQIDFLETVTSFNIQGRYADYKSQFYQEYNKQSTAQKYLKATSEFIIWLEKELTKK